MKTRQVSKRKRLKMSLFTCNDNSCVNMELYTVIYCEVFYLVCELLFCIFVFISVTLLSMISIAMHFEDKENLGWNLRQNTDA